MKPYPRCHRITGALSALVITTFLGLGFAQTSASQETKNPLKNYPKIPIKEGDRCFVCNTPLTESGVAFLYRGRRVAVGTFHVRTFFNNPLKYFSRLQPRGALFQEDIVPESPLKPGWLVFGIWITLGLVAAAFCTHTALRKGRSPAAWFFIGLATNLIGVLVALRQSPLARVDLPPNLAKIPTTVSPMSCPDCGAGNHPSAWKCSGCGARLQPTMESEVQRTERSS